MIDRKTYRIKPILFNFRGSNLISPGNVIYFMMLLAAGGIYYRQSEKLFLPRFINNYLNDFLCIPLVLGLLWAPLCFFKGYAFKFPLYFITAIVLYYAAYFEYYLPQVNPRYTGDWIDALLYGLGGTVFYCYQSLAKSS